MWTYAVVPQVMLRKSWTRRVMITYDGHTVFEKRFILRSPSQFVAEWDRDGAVYEMRYYDVSARPLRETQREVHFRSSLDFETQVFVRLAFSRSLDFRRDLRNQLLFDLLCPSLVLNSTVHYRRGHCMLPIYFGPCTWNKHSQRDFPCEK